MKLLNAALPLDKQRLTSIFSQPAYWCNIPAKNRLESFAFRSYSRFYLGISVLPNTRNCFACKNHQDVRGMHDSRCPNFLSMIHNALRDSLNRIMKESGYSVEKEVPKLLNNGTDERPADILWYNSPNGRDQCLDVSVVCYSIEDGISRSETEKNAKYLEDCQALFLSFTPLLINTLGKFSEKFMETLDFTARQLANTSDLTIGQARYRVRSQVKFGLLSAIGKAFSCKLKAF